MADARYMNLKGPKLLSLITEPNPLLHLPSEPVLEVDDEVRKLMDDMLFSMYHYGGIGLAAVQVGVLQKVVVIDVSECAKGCDNTVSGVRHHMPLFMVNPEIVAYSGTPYSYKEGCLSFPGIYAEIERLSNITIKFLDYNGEVREMQVEDGVLAVCIQHEIDHTNGIVFVDHLSRVKRDLLIKKVSKYKAKQVAKANNIYGEKG